MVVLVALLALLVGAALNHLADRMPTRERVDAAPECGYCGTPRSRACWISTVAYVVGRYRCPSCGAPISIRHPATEMATVLAWVGLYQSRGATAHFLLGAFYACVFLLVLIIDLEHRLILNLVILPAIVVALAGSFLPDPPDPQSAVLGSVVGFLFFWLIAVLGRGAMGAGDVKLAAFIGAATGFPSVITALVFGIFVGGIVAVVLLACRVKTLKSYIPYGPFLVFGGVLVVFFSPLLRQVLVSPY